MMPNLEHAEHVRDYIIRLRFDDGTIGDVDLKDELWGEVFEPMKAAEMFKSFRLDRELNTLIWPTGADLAPEFLYEQAVATQLVEPAKK